MLTYLPPFSHTSGLCPCCRSTIEECAQYDALQPLQVSHGSGFILAKLDGKPGWSSPLPFHVTTTGVGVTIGYSEVRFANTKRGSLTNDAEEPCNFASWRISLVRCRWTHSWCSIQLKLCRSS